MNDRKFCRNLVAAIPHNPIFCHILLASDYQQINIENSCHQISKRFSHVSSKQKHILQVISFNEVSTLSGLDKNETSLD